jgi:hypothetical protein
VGKGLVRRPLVTRAHPSLVGVAIADNALGEGVGLQLGGGVRVIKSHCESMEGLLLHSLAKQAVPHCHLGAFTAPHKHRVV